MTITNPLAGKGVNTVWELTINVLNVALPISSILFVAMILFAGFQYMTGTTDSDKMKGAQTTMKNAVTGLVIVASAFVILRIIEKALYGK